MKEFISDFVYGSTDGIITTFAIVAGASGASLDYLIIIILGVSNVLADGFSMATSRYLSAQAEEEILKKENRERDQSPLSSAIVTFISFVVMGIIPLLAFIVGHITSKKKNMYYLSYFFTALALFFVGLVKGYSIHINPYLSGLKVLTIGGIASIISFVVGRYLNYIK